MVSHTSLAISPSNTLSPFIMFSQRVEDQMNVYRDIAPTGFREGYDITELIPSSCVLVICIGQAVRIASLVDLCNWSFQEGPGQFLYIYTFI